VRANIVDTERLTAAKGGGPGSAAALREPVPPTAVITPARRRFPLWLLAAVPVVAAAVIGGVVFATQSGSKSKTNPTAVPTVAQTAVSAAPQAGVPTAAP